MKNSKGEACSPQQKTADLVENPKLQAAIQRVMQRAGESSKASARYDRQYHRHNKSKSRQ